MSDGRNDSGTKGDTTPGDQIPRDEEVTQTGVNHAAAMDAFLESSVIAGSPQDYENESEQLIKDEEDTQPRVPNPLLADLVPELGPDSDLGWVRGEGMDESPEDDPNLRLESTVQNGTETANGNGVLQIPPELLNLLQGVITHQTGQSQASQQAREEQERLREPAPMRTDALEYIANELSRRGLTEISQIKERLFQVGFIATMEACWGTVGPVLDSTPLYRLSFDDDTNALDFDFLDGEDEVVDLTGKDVYAEYADFCFSSFVVPMIRLLSEGITGVGKTHTLEQIGKAVYHPRNRKTVRLNPNNSNVVDPYIWSEMDDGGIFREYINQRTVREIAFTVIDEQNRGDSNAVIGLMDGQVNLSTGETAHIGLPIPGLRKDASGKIVGYEIQGRYKPVVIHSSQNPPTADYNVRGTEGAVGNRQIKVEFPDTVLYGGDSTTQSSAHQNNVHGRFMELFTEIFSRYTGADEDRLRELLLPQDNSEDEEIRANSEYTALHAFCLDPQNARNKYVNSALEIRDHFKVLSGGKSLEHVLKKEVDIAKKWTTQLQGAGYQVDFGYAATVEMSDAQLGSIEAVRTSFGDTGLIKRDITKTTNIADAVALMIRYKRAIQQSVEGGTNFIDEFVRLQTNLTIREVASAFAVTLSDKVTQRDNGDQAADPLTIVKQGVNDYVDLLKTFSEEIYSGLQETDPAEYQRRTTFDLNDRDQGIRYACAYMAIDFIVNDSGLSGDEYAQKMVGTLNRVAGILRNQDKDNNETKKFLISRVNADIASMAGFIYLRRNQIADAFNATQAGDFQARYDALINVVRGARDTVRFSYTEPRVQRMLSE